MVYAVDQSAQATSESERSLQSLLGVAKELGPVLEAHADYADSELRLADEVVTALCEAQLFRIWQPKRYSGLESNVLTQVLVTAELGQYCSSAAWVTALYGACQWFAALYSKEAQEEVFGRDTNARVCGVLAPSAIVKNVEGGIVVDGRWNYASGCVHASWATVGAPRSTGEEGTDLLLIPMRDLVIEKTWDTAGTRGTGSHTICAKNVFVPGHRVLPFFCADGVLGGHIATEYSEEHLYKTPAAGFATICVVGPLLGIAKRALRHTLEHIKDRAVAYTFAQDQSQLVSTQLAVAEAATKIDSAELHIQKAAADLDIAAPGEKEFGLLPRVRTRQHIGWGTQQLRDAMVILKQVNGSSDMQRGSTFERIWRDFNTSSAHAVLDTSTTSEVYGKVLCGHEPSVLSALY